MSRANARKMDFIIFFPRHLHEDSASMVKGYINY